MSYPDLDNVTRPVKPVHDRRSLWLMLVSLVVLQFAYPVTLDGPVWTVVYLLFYGGIITFGVRTANADPRRYWPIFVTSAALLVCGTWFAFQQNSASATTAMLIAVGVMQAALLVTFLAVLLHPPSHARTVDLLLVAVCAYLLMGGVFGVIASVIEAGFPGSYIDNTATGEPLAWQSLFYGSYVTLATLGFGDVVPVSGWARSISSFEAVLGMLFVAVVIARLVGVAGLMSRDKAEVHHTFDS